MNTKIDIQLGDIQETLLLPLSARVIESKLANGILKDPKSVEIAEKMNFNYRKIGKEISETGVAGLVVRSVKFDQHIKAFQHQHPQGKILTLGAGLDTSFYRCDNGQTIWYDLDLEDTMALRENLLPAPNERVHYIRKSLFDITWIDDLGSIEGGLLILAPGVFPYFHEAEIRDLLKVIAPKLPGAYLTFDIISQLGILLINNRIHEAGMKNAHLRWGIIEAGEIEKWSDNIELAGAEPYFKDIHHLERFHFFTRQIMKINDFLSITQIVQLKFI